MSEEVYPPMAYVRKPRLIKNGRIDKGLRVGRGFSIRELKEVGLTLREAMRLGLYVDKRRRSKHEWNVKILEEFLKKIKYVKRIKT